MEKTLIKTLRTASRAITTDARRLKKAVNVLHVLDGFTGAGNGELEAAARAELEAALHSLQAHAARIAETMDEAVAQSIDA